MTTANRYILMPHSRSPIPRALSALSAGPGREVEESHEPLDVCELITGGRSGFIAYTVDGDSMYPSIKPGSVVFVDSSRAPREGDVVVARVNGLNCIKKYRRSRRGLFLVSSNQEYEPREITEDDDFHVMGVVTSHLEKLVPIVLATVSVWLGVASHFL